MQPIQLDQDTQKWVLQQLVQMDRLAAAAQETAREAFRMAARLSNLPPEQWDQWQLTRDQRTNELFLSPIGEVDDLMEQDVADLGGMVIEGDVVPVAEPG